MKTVLLIDDDKSIRETITDILTDEGYNVISAENGMRGINLCKDNDVDIALVDLWLPNIDGMTVIQEMLKIKPDIKIIVISAHGNIQTAVDALKIGAKDFLEKPISIDKLLESIRNLTT